MRKTRHFQLLLSALALLLFVAPNAKAEGEYAWPENYGGVMLQGFYWDGYDDSSWNSLSSQAGELADYFDLIWVPNSGKSGSNPSMGYNPVYWFTNHNSSFGTETELREMIQTFKQFGTGIIEDVVVNHRNGATNWHDFPGEEWNGKTYQLGLDAICKNDEMANESGQPKPTGNYDTGDNFDGSRDLDHTNASVQENVKAYLNFLLNDLGYAGFRYDMVKGYGAQYTKMYNEAAKPRFSVGEYWDNYDNTANWIEGTGKQSAAFDFEFKWAVNSAFASLDFSKLVWMRNGTLPQPAGLVHMDTYQRYAVTFVDNHDTDKESDKVFKGDVAAAYAFMLCSPGTPCVFLKHWLSNKEDIKRLIAIRKSVGLTNMCKVDVIEHLSSRYVAKVSGDNGELYIKIGRGSYMPSGYSEADKVAGNNYYTIYTKVPVKDLDTKRPVVKFSPDGGNYDGSVQVTISVENAPSDATVVYTTDGTTPSLENGLQVKPGAVVSISRNTVLKAAVASAGAIVSVVKTASYRTELKPVTVYLQKPEWEKVYFYAWTGEGELLGKFPGTEITETVEKNGKTWYKWTGPAGVYVLNVIFTNGIAPDQPEAAQTVNIENVEGTHYYVLDGFAGKTITVTDVTAEAGVEEAVAECEVAVYPNPVSEVLHVKSVQKVVSVEIFTASGALQLRADDGEVNVSALQPGFYFYRIVFADGTRSQGTFVKK